MLKEPLIINNDQFQLDGKVYPMHMYHFYDELRRIEKLCENDPEHRKDDEKWQRKATHDVLQLIKVFSDQNHSGFSAGYILDLFYECVQGKPLTPLTGEDDEWELAYPKDESDDTEMNKRNRFVRRIHHDNSTAYNIEGVYFKEPGEDSRWFASKESKTPVKFPCDEKDLEPKYYRLKYKATFRGDHTIENQLKNGWFEEEKI